MKAKYWMVLAAIIAIFLLGRQCGIKSVLKTVHVDTTVHKDSLVIRYKPVPYKVVDVDTLFMQGKPTPYAVHDTVKEVVTRYIDTSQVINKYFETAYYKDVHDVKRGTVTILDTVTQNRIIGRQLQVNIADTVIKETMALHPPNHFVMYFGVDYFANAKNPFYAGGVNLSAKLPNEKIFTVGVLVDKENKIVYQGGIKIPIRPFKKYR